MSDYRKRARKVCTRLAAGRTLDSICAEQDMPGIETVRGWMLDSPDFYGRYLRAKQIHAERLTEEIVTLADALPEGASEGEIRRQRLRIEARKWAASRLAPRAYGESPPVDPSDFAPVVVEFNFPREDGSEARDDERNEAGS